MLGGQIEHNVPLDNISVIEMYSNEVSTTRSGFTRSYNSQLVQPTQTTTAAANTSSSTNNTTSTIINNMNSSAKYSHGRINSNSALHRP